MRLRYCFDTSALNTLLRDPDREFIIAGLLATGVFRVTAYNVIEAMKTRDAGVRRELLRLIRRLADGKRPLDLPKTIVRSIARAFVRRHSRDGSVSINSDPDLDGLCVAMNDPDLVDNTVRLDTIGWTRASEDDFDSIAVGARERFQCFFEKTADHPPITAAGTLRSYLRIREHVIDSLVVPIFARETGRTVNVDEREELVTEPIWALYLGAYAYGMHQRSVKRNTFSRDRGAGAIDLTQAVYLRFCDRFITDDRPQYRALRLLNRFNQVEPAVVMRYETFRRRLILPAVAFG